MTECRNGDCDARTRQTIAPMVKFLAGSGQAARQPESPLAPRSVHSPAYMCGNRVKNGACATVARPK